MKSVLIIGMGRLGHHLCMNMAHMGNEIMIVDKNEENMQDLLSYAMMAKVGDCTKEEVLKSLGVGNFDICFVCIGSDFQNSLEITSLLKELGASYVVSKATRDIQAKFLLRNGADEVIYPERDAAERCAVKYGSNKVFDYIEMAEGYSILEIPPMHGWVGKSIGQLAVRSRYHVSILGIKVDGHLQFLPHPDRVLDKKDHLMIVGMKKDIDRILANIE